MRHEPKSTRKKLAPKNTTLLLLCFAFSAAHANIVGTAQQNFNPATDGLDFVTVQSTQTLKPGIFNLGAFLNYAVNSLPYIDSATQSRVKLNDTLLSADFNLGFGLFHRLDVGLSVPMVLRQTVQDQGDVHGQFTANGNTEIRPNVKYRLLGEDDGGLAAIGSVNFDRISNDPYTGHGAGPTYNLELAADTTIQHYRLALNVGRRFRNSGSKDPAALVDPLHDQWIASAAASYLLTSIDTKLIAELFAATPVNSENTNVTRNLTSSEILLGAKHDLTNQLALHAGAGAGLQQGVSSPAWRVYAGLNYTFGPLWGRPTTVEPVAAAVTESPRATAEPQAEKVANANPENFSVGNILFDFNSAKLADNHVDVLAPLVDHMRTHKFKRLVIEGHTDSVGRKEYNLNLSRRRASVIHDYLVNLGFPAAKIQAEGYGSEKPIADNANFQGREANRRVEFHFQY